MIPSFAQHQRLVGGRHVHALSNTVAIGLRLVGALNVDALSRAVAELLRRHEALRMVFPGDDSVELHTDGAPLWTIEADDPSRALEILVRNASRPFDLARGPLFRVTLVRVAPTLHLLGLELDHQITDGWSNRVLVQDLLHLYSAFAADEAPPPPPAALRFASFAEQERSRNFDRQVHYWRKQLAGISLVPDSGLRDRPGSPGVGEVSVTVDAAPIVDFARSHGVSPVPVITAAVQAVTWKRRLSWMRPDEAADVAIISWLANRIAPLVDHTVGYFATRTVLRTDLSGDPGFAEVVDRASRTLWGALRHQRVPHAALLRLLEPGRYGSIYDGAAPAFLELNVSSGMQLPRMPGLLVEQVEVPLVRVPAGGLKVSGLLAGGELVLRMAYREELFSSEWCEGFLGDVRGYVVAGVQDPAVCL
ncbi:condensation domain-containing protein [Allokutzneria albata]|uniref:Condensation domain-containing protein n=1 Tax=Allokutzneria albata TaxID=211114 RepID=A0A1G9RL88_ALLAB|nr:condensation domain-containing protein [Allokutzneria albata]SDM23185.1 Condensation domain-containing protein [Allokutzneria albata]